MKYINKILNSFSWNDGKCFLLSITPSYKYSMTMFVFSVAGISAIVENLFGFNYMTFIAFIALMILEIGTGVYASTQVRKEAFQSTKMSRFSIKLAIILLLLFITFQFQKGFKQDNSAVSILFNWIWNFLFAWFSLEYLFSVLENYASIKGKDASSMIKSIKEKFTTIFGITPIFTLLFCSVLFTTSSCSRKSVASLEMNTHVAKDSVVIEERLQVDTVRIAGDSTISYIQLNCDSLGHVIPVSLAATSLRANSSIAIDKSGLLVTKCNCDDWQQLVYTLQKSELRYKGEYSALLKKTEASVQVQHTSKFAKFCIWYSVVQWLLALIYAGYKAVTIYIKSQTKIPF